MKIILKCPFVNYKASLLNMRFLNDLNATERNVFFDFCENVLSDKTLEGKNKPSNHLTSNTLNHPILLNHYAIFKINNFRHYHLGLDFSIYKNICYSFFNKLTLVPKLIIDNNDKIGEYKASNMLINYQIVDEAIIIYNITLHKAWPQIIEQICSLGISRDFSQCQECFEIYPEETRCTCIPNARKIEYVYVEEILNFGSGTGSKNSPCTQDTRLCNLSDLLRLKQNYSGKK